MTFPTCPWCRAPDHPGIAAIYASKRGALTGAGGAPDASCPLPVGDACATRPDRRRTGRP
jgi:hypothetical protein